MGTQRSSLTRRQAARILDGELPETGSALGVLLAAATAPATTQELNAELDAVAMFRTWRATPPVASRPASAVSVARRLSAAPAAAVAAAVLVLGGGGVALAASNGALHVPFTGHDHRSAHAPSAPTAVNPGLSHQRPAHPHPTGAAVAPPRTGAADPHPSLRGLCTAYQAGATHDGKTNPAFTSLYDAAGGQEHVAAFCADLIGPASRPTHAPHPTHPAHPSQAATPAHPLHPTEAATPTHPAHPSPKAHATPSAPATRATQPTDGADAHAVRPTQAVPDAG